MGLPTSLARHSAHRPRPGGSCILLGRIALPVEIGRIVRWHLDAGAAGKDRVLFGATATQQQIFHTVYFEEFGRVHVLFSPWQADPPA
jgi:hypothetical protein